MNINFLKYLNLLKNFLIKVWAWIKRLTFKQIIALIALGGGITYAIIYCLQDNSPATVAVIKPRVEVQELKASETINKLNLSGYTECVRRVTLRAEICGKVKKIVKEKGSPVETGDEIVLIEENNHPALLEEAQARFTQKDLEYKSAVKLKEKAFKAENDLAATKANLATAKSALALCEKNMSATRICAPFQGTLEEKFVDVGAFVNVGDTIAEIVDLNPLKVICHVPEKNIDGLSVGMRAIVQLAHVVPSPIVGKVSYLSKHADAKTRTFQVEILIDNPDLKIPSGLTAQAAIDLNTIRGHYISPALISLRDDGVMGIKIVDQGKVSFVPVNLENATPEGIWVTGLPETISLITVGGDYVVEGQEVEPVLKDKA